MSISNTRCRIRVVVSPEGSQVKRILIIDDDVGILRLLEELVQSLIEELNKGVVEILTATSGPEGLDIISKHNIDILLTDNSMPLMSGIDLIRILSSELQIKKVLMTFGALEVQDRVMIAYAGADEILPKPIDEDRLKKLLRKFL